MSDSLSAKTGRVLSLMLAAIIALPGTLAAQDEPKRTVKLATLNWEPYYGEDLKNGGFITELARESFRRAGYEMTVDFIPWSRAMARAERGIVDGLLGAYYNEERDRKFHFSDNLYNDNVGLIALEELGVESYDSLRDLEGMTIGMGRDFSVSPAFDNADFLDKAPARNNRANVHKLFAGRIEMVVDSWIVLSNLVKEAGYSMDKVVFIQPPLQTRGVYVAISKEIENGRAVAQAMNAGLSGLHANGTYQEILDKHGMPIEGSPRRDRGS